jgi:hypothetical protein
MKNKMTINKIIYFLKMYGIDFNEDFININFDEDGDYIITHNEYDGYNEYQSTTTIFKSDIEEYDKLKEEIKSKCYNKIK